jgi:alkylation response protein AidB-like acyl-CoA dehydrogenase
MKFDFEQDQRLLQAAVRDFLAGELPVERVRALWDTETGRSPELWSGLAELGIPGLLVPENRGGLGLDEIDLVLLLEETGRAALAEPLVATAAVAVPLLRDLGGALAERWLTEIAGGRAIVAVGHPVNAFTSDAHVADLLLLTDAEEIHAVEPAAVTLTRQAANDPARRIYSIDWTPSQASLVGRDEEAQRQLAAALDRGALACAAQALGVADRLVELSVAYACQRHQFGAPIGSFQAVKHLLANVQVAIEYARPAVYRAAHSIARNAAGRAVDVSMAKRSACEAAQRAARVALQVHGAIGYTWEQDVHVWMRRAWSLALAWGDAAWHTARVAEAVLDGAGPAHTFGYSAPSAGESIAPNG